MILDIGEKVHIIERRLFADDLRRHLVGEITRCTENAIQLKAYVWVFHQLKGFVRKPEKRERVLYLSDRLTINVIPREVKLEEIQYVNDPKKGLYVSDGKQFNLEINEFGDSR
jgi:hypothetical protein